MNLMPSKNCLSAFLIEIRYFENDEWTSDSYMSSWQETIVEVQKYLSDNNTNHFNNPVYLPFDAVRH